MSELVTRIVCSHCGCTKAEVRRQGDWIHEHEWIRWTGEETIVGIPTPLNKSLFRALIDAGRH